MVANQPPEESFRNVSFIITGSSGVKEKRATPMQRTRLNKPASITFIRVGWEVMSMLIPVQKDREGANNADRLESINIYKGTG